MADPSKFTSLAAVTAVGAGSALANVGTNSLFTMQVILTGSPTAAIVVLEGSLDNGTTYSTILTWDIAAGRASGDLVTIAGYGVDNVRARLTTLTGGTVPTVTAIVMAMEDGAAGGGGTADAGGDTPVADGSAVDTSGNITASGQSITATNLDGYSTVTFSISGTYAGLSATFEQSDNGGANWYSIDADRVGSGIVENGCVNLTNAAVLYRATTSGSDSFRVRSTALTSGTAAVLISITALPTGSGVGVTTSFTDMRPDSGTITVIDSGSTTTAYYHGSNQITGTPTGGSVFAYAVNGVAGWYVLITGTWTGTLSFEKSLDGGTTWVATSVHVDSTAEQVLSVTGNCSARGASAGATNIRVRATAAMTGTAVVRLVFAAADTVVTVTNSIAEMPRAITAASGQLVRPANTTTYTANDEVSATSPASLPVTVTDVADMPVTLTGIKVSSSDTGFAATQLRVWVYNGATTAGTDNAVFSTAKANYLGTFSGTLRAASDGSVGRLTPDEGNFLIGLPASTLRTMQLRVQTLGAPVPSANSTTFDFTVEGFQARA